MQEGSFVTPDAANKLWLMFQSRREVTSGDKLLLLLQSCPETGGFVVVSSCLMQPRSYCCLKEKPGSRAAGVMVILGQRFGPEHHPDGPIGAVTPLPGNDFAYPHPDRTAVGDFTWLSHRQLVLPGL